MIHIYVRTHIYKKHLGINLYTDKMYVSINKTYK